MKPHFKTRYRINETITSKLRELLKSPNIDQIDDEWTEKLKTQMMKEIEDANRPEDPEIRLPEAQFQEIVRIQSERVCNEMFAELTSNIQSIVDFLVPYHWPFKHMAFISLFLLAYFPYNGIFQYYSLCNEKFKEDRQRNPNDGSGRRSQVFLCEIMYLALVKLDREYMESMRGDVNYVCDKMIRIVEKAMETSVFVEDRMRPTDVKRHKGTRDAKKTTIKIKPLVYRDRMNRKGGFGGFSIALITRIANEPITHTPKMVQKPDYYKRMCSDLLVFLLTHSHVIVKSPKSVFWQFVEYYYFVTILRPDVSPRSALGVCVYLHFFTLTHLLLLEEDTRNIVDERALERIKEYF